MNESINQSINQCADGRLGRWTVGYRNAPSSSAAAVAAAAAAAVVVVLDELRDAHDDWQLLSVDAAGVAAATVAVVVAMVVVWIVSADKMFSFCCG